MTALAIGILVLSAALIVSIKVGTYLSDRDAEARQARMTGAAMRGRVDLHVIDDGRDRTNDERGGVA